MSLAITTTPAGNALRRIAAMPAALALLSSVLLLGACASVPMPVEQMAVAEAAVQHATTTGTNATNAAEVQAASAKLARARQAMADKQPLLARRLAEQVEVEARLQALDTKKAERGLVVTLGDVLFDSGQSRLLADGSRNMVRLAEVFKRNPARSASIEGYTDNVSSASANMSLAGRRADAVVAALIGLGVSADRLCSVAHGEDMPAARNHSPACRQMNRRVEVVFAPQGDEPSPRALWGRRAPSPHHPITPFYSASTGPRGSACPILITTSFVRSGKALRCPSAPWRSCGLTTGPCGTCSMRSGVPGRTASSRRWWPTSARCSACMCRSGQRSSTPR